MVRVNNCQLSLALSLVALGCSILNTRVEGREYVITSFVIFMLTEITFFIKSIQMIRDIWNNLESCEHIFIVINVALSLFVTLGSAINSVCTGSYFLFYGCEGVVVLPVLFSVLILWQNSARVVYDVRSILATIKGRFASPPSMEFDVAVVERENGRKERVCLPAYSESDNNPPAYSTYDEDPPTYDESCFNDGEESEDDYFLGGSSEISIFGRCMNYFCNGIPGYRASRHHEVIERGGSREVVVDMEETI